ncbi:MAG: GAF domain-containing protein [Anaerolineales bacterium]|nr:GAF domain-containing protein [Anaerolineales bacterium]
MTSAPPIVPIGTAPLSDQRRLALLYRVGREISGRLDLDELLPRVLKATVESAQSKTGSIIVINEARDIVYSALMMDGALQPDPDRRLAGTLDTGLAGWVLNNRQPVLVPDTTLDERWGRRPDDSVTGAKSAIAVPLMGRARVVGVLTLVKTPAQSFSDQDLSLMVAIADQAGVAIENAQLYFESERRAQAMHALAETSQAINSTLKLEMVLHLVAKNARDLLNVETAAIALVSQKSLVFREAVGRMAERLRGLELELGAGIAGWVAQSNESVLTTDVPRDPRFRRGMDQQTGLLTLAGAAVPVRVQDKVIGVIEVMNPPDGRFAPDTMSLLESLAALAATAIVHAQQVEELQAAESRFSSLFEDNIDPIIITDLDGLVSDANRKAVEVFGYKRDSLIGLRVSTVHRMGTAFLGSARFQHLRGGQEITYQTRITTRDGSEIPMEVHAKMIKRKGQEFIQWIQRDISERLQLEEMRNDLISMIFHDLRSPLGNILSSLDVVQASIPEDSETEQMLLKIATRSAMRMSRMVDSLLDLRRLEAGQVNLNREQTDVGVLVGDAIEQVSPVAEGKGIELRKDISPRLPMIDIDADMIRRVIINLIENAVKYTPSGTTVTTAARAGATELTFSVKDNGPGIPPAEQQRIFSKFTRLRHEAAPKGLGLGLAFCKFAVEAHGGRIWVESQLGQGANFSFTMPYNTNGA